MESLPDVSIIFDKIQPMFCQHVLKVFSYTAQFLSIVCYFSNIYGKVFY